MVARIPYFKTAPDLVEVRTLYRALAHRNFQSTAGPFAGWTGLREPLGSADSTEWYNTPLALSQLEWTMALTRHPLVRRFAGLSRPFLEGDLVAEQILQGMRILDLGCGREPAFARVARVLGADVYTVDTLSADRFRSIRTWSPEARALETDRHISVDLLAEDAADRIMTVAQEGFDLVTSANLEAASPLLWLQAMWAGLLQLAGREPLPPLQERIARRVGTRPAVVLIAREADSFIRVI